MVWSVDLNFGLNCLFDFYVWIVCLNCLLNCCCKFWFEVLIWVVDLNGVWNLCVLELWRLLMSQEQDSMLFCLMLVKDWGGSWTRLVERAYPFWCAVQRVARMYAFMSTQSPSIVIRDGHLQQAHPHLIGRGRDSGVGWGCQPRFCIRWGTPHTHTHTIV